ncbi:EF-hand domain-containing protein [Caenimonas aquaedulcis]|uniref:EF-hand domain-containing protein n=1 Tax=Caenimonas aquaedulcis TaxID=2793270 RepID=A0A931H5S3_9BURK|nr:EF-hand domain-containing protein [Caenimonas aquaedulcis]MBG9389096.1 EF-hand domain-containing protein [Caenimonas aquaedulcis]
MTSLSVSRAALRLACLAALLAANAGHAQTQRAIGSAPPVPGPSLAARTAIPNNVSNPGVPAGSPVVDPGVQQTNVMGAGGGSRPVLMLPGSYTPVQVAGSFIAADGNRDGELTRAEAQRLTIAPFSFEDMDANHDGVLTRSEYEDALR